MKQNITIEQLGELTADQKDKLQNWWDTSQVEGYHHIIADIMPGGSIRFLPLLSIGQCIELLGGQTGQSIYNIHYANAGWGLQIYEGPNPLPDNWRDYISIKMYHKELIDALWDAIKKSL